jgi:hypothetical protein
MMPGEQSKCRTNASEKMEKNLEKTESILEEEERNWRKMTFCM